MAVFLVGSTCVDSRFRSSTTRNETSEGAVDQVYGGVTFGCADRYPGAFRHRPDRLLRRAFDGPWSIPGRPGVRSPAMTIYLDHAATTPLRREVLDAMLPYLTEVYGNPSSAHAAGRVARAGLDDAHERVAARLGAEAREIVFTSGGTEANNLAIKGAAWAGKARGHRIVTSAVEHHAVGHALRYLEKFGFEIVELPVDRYGRVDPDQLDAALTDQTILVSIMLANNEVGTIQPIEEIAARVRARRGVLLHVDAVQAAPYVDVDVRTLGADLVSIGAHKFEGPKGVGVLFVRHGTHLLAQQHGGTQERHRRAGTENVAGAVGLATAYDLSCEERPATVARLRRARSGSSARSWPCRARSSPAIRPTACPASSRSSPAARTACRSRCRSTSRASPRPSARRARPARPRSATS